MAQSVLDDLASIPVGLLVFEDYGPINKMAGKIAQRAEMCGIIKHYALARLAVPVVTTPPTALKQFATGKGNATKDMMLAEAASSGYFPDSSDEADAFFAARLGLQLGRGDKVAVSYSTTLPSA